MIKTKSDGESDFYVYPYVNGRERGFCIIKNKPQTKAGKYVSLDEKKTIVFSENRSSDGMIYIIGKAKDFNIWDNGGDCTCKTEKFWKANRKIFESDQIKQTVRMLKKELGVKA